MAVFVCLLRAIGPVTHAKMSMAALREGCAAAGFENISTVGNTGNLLLTSKGTAASVRETVQEVVDGFGIRSEVFVRTPRQLAAVVAANPFPDAAKDHPAALGVCFFHSTPQWPDWLRHYEGPEALATVTSHLVIDYHSPTAVWKLDVEKRLGKKMTQRNWRVTANLAERSRAPAKI